MRVGWGGGGRPTDREREGREGGENTWPPRRNTACEGDEIGRTDTYCSSMWHDILHPHWTD